MSADVCGRLSLSGQMSADVCEPGQSASEWLAAVSASVCDQGKRLLCMRSHVCGCLRKEKLMNFYFWQMSAALETKTTPKQGVRPWDFDFCAFLCRGANIAAFPDGEIHSKMETPTGPQTNPACIKTDAHRTNAFATWRSRWSLAFALTMQHHHEEKKLPPHLTNPKKTSKSSKKRNHLNLPKP